MGIDASLWLDEDDGVSQNLICGHCGGPRIDVKDWDAKSVPPNGIPGEHRSCGLAYFGISPAPGAQHQAAPPLAGNLPSKAGSVDLGRCDGFRKRDGGRGRPSRDAICVCGVSWSSHD